MQKVIWEGNRIDENGYLLDEKGNYLYNEEGEYILSENLESFGEADGEGLSEGVSNPSAPAPLEDDTDPIEGNDMESEGITNEEAGLE